MSGRGWFFFLIGLVISSFLGGGLRIYLSPQRVRAWVEAVAAQKQPKFILQFDRVRVSMADGWLPGLAVEFKNLNLMAKDSCITGSDIRIDRLSVPVPLRSIFDKHIRFGQIHADSLDYRYRPANCETEISIPKAMAETPTQSLVARVEGFMTSKWSKELRNTFEILNGLTIGRMRVFHESASDPIFTLNNLEALNSEKALEAVVRFAAVPGILWVGDLHMGAVQSEVRASPERIRLIGKGNLVEGQYHIDIDWSMSDGQIQFQTEARDIPAKPLVKLWERWGLLSWPEPQLENEWFKCRVSGAGFSRNWTSMPTQFTDCNFYGELGKILIRDAEVTLLQGKVFPLSASLEGVQVVGLPGMGGLEIDPESRMHGEMKMSSANDLVFDGVMMKPGLRLQQYPSLHMVGEKVNFKWSRQAWKHSIQFSDWVAEGKNQKITLDISNSDPGPAYRLKWDVRSPNYPDFVPKSIFISDWKDLHSTGVIRWGDTGLNDVKSEITAAELRFEDLSIAKTKVFVTYTERKGHFDLQGESAHGLENAPLRLLSRIHELTGWPDTQSGVRLNLDFEPNGRWVVNPMSFGHLGRNKSQASFIGRGYGMAVDEGVLTVKDASKPTSKFQVFGTLTEPRVEVPEL